MRVVALEVQVARQRLTLHLMEEREKEKKDPQEEGKLRAIALRLCKIKKLFAVDIEEKDSEVRLTTQKNTCTVLHRC